MPLRKQDLLALVSALFLSACALYALAQIPESTTSPSSQPYKSFGPVTDYNAALPNLNDVLRFRRGERYNSPNSPLPELGEQSDPVLVGEDMSSFYQDPLPFGQSDAVVVGKVTSGQTHLSNDKRDIYCEFEVTVQEALKVPGALSIQANETIDIERQGGAVRLPSGKVLLRGSKDYSMPLIGKRYLLFLKYSQSTEDFHVVTGYQLEGRHTYKLDELGYSYSERHHETLIHPLREQGESEEQFLSRARAVKPPNKGGK